MFLPCFRMVPRQNNQYKDQAVGNVNSIKDLCEMRDEIRALLLRFGFASFASLPRGVFRLAVGRQSTVKAKQEST